MASATISRYRGSNTWSGRKTFGKSTTLGSGNRGSRSDMCTTALVNGLGLLVHVVHQDVLAQGIRRREVRLAFADLGDSTYEAHQVVVAREHEGVDHDAALAARGHFGARLGDDEG